MNIIILSFFIIFKFSLLFIFAKISENKIINKLPKKPEPYLYSGNFKNQNSNDAITIINVVEIITKFLLKNLLFNFFLSKNNFKKIKIIKDKTKNGEFFFTIVLN